MQRLAFMNTAISDLKDSKVLPILPSDYFYNHTNKACEVYTDDKLLYANANHLGALGSRYPIGSIEAQLSKFIVADEVFHKNN